MRERERESGRQRKMESEGWVKLRTWRGEKMEKKNWDKRQKVEKGGGILVKTVMRRSKGDKD